RNSVGDLLGNAFDFGLLIAQLFRGLGVEAVAGGILRGLSDIAFGGGGAFESFGGAGQLADLDAGFFTLRGVPGGLDFGGGTFDRAVGALQTLLLRSVGGFIGTLFE